LSGKNRPILYSQVICYEKKTNRKKQIVGIEQFILYIFLISIDFLSLFSSDRFLMATSASSVPATAAASASSTPPLPAVAANGSASAKSSPPSSHLNKEEDDDEEETGGGQVDKKKESKQKTPRKADTLYLANELTHLQPSLKKTRERVNAGKKQLLEMMRKHRQKKVRDADGEKEYYLEKKAKKPTLKMYHVENATEKCFELTNRERRRFLEEVLRQQINDTPDVEVKLKVKSLKRKKKKVESDSEEEDEEGDQEAMSDDERSSKRQKS
jgi:hypothetical protein